MTDAILVTGGTGFIGRKLISRLVSDGFEVYALVRPGRSSAVLRGATALEDPGTTGLKELLDQVAPLACFHLATYFVAQHSRSDVGALIEANVAFGTRVADALAGPRRTVFINAGTAWQHVNSEGYRPASLYAATKQAFQDILQHFAESAELRVVNVKLFDTYGPTDNRPKLINLLFGAAAEGTTLELSPGEQFVDLLHVDDAVSALIAAWQAAPHNGHVNFAASSGAPTTLREIVATVQGVTGGALDVRFGAKPYRAVEMFEPWTAGLPPPEWSPTITLREGLAAMWQVRK